MPKLGLKCFLGSFLLSLVAVFAVTKAYFVLSMSEQKRTDNFADSLPAKNIELFAANEENDPLYDKFNDLNNSKALPWSNNDETSSPEASQESYATDDVLYQPETDNASDDIIRQDEIQTAEAPVTDDSDISISDTVLSEESGNSDELLIADASAAPVFKIPLIHRYTTENGTVTYSDSADDNQIASASADVPLDNLGVDKTAALTEPLADNEELIAKSEFAAGLKQAEVQEDSPWKVAEISNKHTGKNSLNKYAAEHRDSIVAPDQEITDEPREEYRMQENILIPIPDSIKNERNLTPQFSTSEENLRLERELRAKHTLPALTNDTVNGADGANTVNSGISTGDEERDFDEDVEDNDDAASKSLTESIAEWFSGSKKKKEEDSITAPDTNVNKSQKSSDNGDGSIFSKLLGINTDGDNGIVPSELKLSFQPNRAEISGQTLEWLHAFSDNSVKNEDVFIEIRIDKSAPYALQEKRLKLLYKILANNGVDYHKINIIFTDREPNSFIIRNTRYASENDKIKAMKRADNPWY